MTDRWQLIGDLATGLAEEAKHKDENKAKEEVLKVLRANRQEKAEPP